MSLSNLAASVLLLLAGPAGAASTPQDFDGLMRELAAAWEVQDTPRALACFTSDATYMQPPDQQLYRGTRELEKLFDGLQPSTFMALHEVAFDQRRQVGFAEFSFGRTGSGSAVHGVVVVRLRDGRIASWREYFESGPEAFSDFVAEEGKQWKWTGQDLE